MKIDTSNLRQPGAPMGQRQCTDERWGYVRGSSTSRGASGTPLPVCLSNDQAQRPEGYADAPCSMDKVLLMAWVNNLRQKARLIRKGVKHMDESCDELADIIEKYATSNVSNESF